MADFAARYLSELESGKGFGAAGKTAATGSMKDIRKSFGKERIARAAFGGDDIFSAYIRGRIGVKKKEEKEKGPTKLGVGEPGGGISSDGMAFLKVIAKNSMSFAGMARDMNVMRQNIVKLVKLKGSKANLGADAFFLKEDERERALEVQRQKYAGKPTPEQKPKTGEGGGGLIDTIMQMFSGGFIDAAKKIFSPKNLLKFLGKAGLVGLIVGAIYGAFKGWKKLFEGGSFKDAFISAWGGFLEVITFGILGEETITKVFDSISSFFEPIIDTISGIFTGIKNFVKSIFGGVAGDIKDETPAKADTVKVSMPGADKMPKGPESITQMAEKAGAPPGAMKDLQGILESGKTGGFGAMMEKAKEFEKKYPSQAPATETSPTPMTKEGVPLEQAQRNYELNKKLTGETSKALGMPLEMPLPPAAASPTPQAPVETAPTPSPEMSDTDKIKQLEGYIERNKNRFGMRRAGMMRHLASFKKAYPDDPDRIKQLEDEYAQTLAVEKKEMEIANEGFQSQINALKKSSKSAPSPTSGGPSPTVSAGESGGGGSSSGGSIPMPSAGGSAPSMESGGPVASGSDVSSASAAVAEGQRMESASDVGSTINAPTINNSASSQGSAKPPTAEAYDADLAKMLMTT